jgi:hypothetical protein
MVTVIVGPIIPLFIVLPFTLVPVIERPHTTGGEGKADDDSAGSRFPSCIRRFSPPCTIVTSHGASQCSNLLMLPDRERCVFLTD